MASERSIWDRAMAQGRAQSEQSVRRHPGRSHAAAAPDDLHRAKDHTKDRAKNNLRNHARHQEAHRPDNAMNRASEKEPKAHSVAPSHPQHHDNPLSSHDGGPADVRKAQAALNQQGFNVGNPDGKLGQRTKKALIAFQKQRGVQTTGRADRATLDALDAGASAPNPGAQSPLGRNGAQQTPPPAQTTPQNVPAEPAATGQESATPAAATQQPADGETQPATAQPNLSNQDGQPLPDASSRVPASAPQEDYREDSVPSENNDQR